MKKFFLLLLAFAGPALAQTPGISRGDLFKAHQFQSYGPTLNLFVDSTGNDGNACTASGTDACLTIQGVLTKVPKQIRSGVLVTVGLGNFAGAFVDGFQFINDLNAPSTGAYLEFNGTLANYVPATGTATGTATGGTTGTSSPIVFGTLVDAAQTWTANDLRGRIVRITGGTGSGQDFIIRSNTGTTITIVGNWTAPTGTSTYVISDWGTTITSGPVRPRRNSSTAANSTQAGFRVNALARSNELLTIKYFKFTTVNSAFDHQGEGDLSFTFNRTQTTSQPVVISQGSVTLTKNFFLIADNQIGISWAAPAAALFSVQDFWRGNSTTGTSLITSITAPNIFAASFQLGAVENLANGIRGSVYSYSTSRFDTITGVCADSTPSTTLLQPSNATIALSDVDFTSCGTAIRAAASSAVSATGIISGATNTTIYNVQQGGSLQVDATSTIAGTTEISVDGTAYTIAALRAMVPKQIVDLGTLSRIVER